jgi:hypothetical protein
VPAKDLTATKRKIADILTLTTGSLVDLKTDDIQAAQTKPGQSAEGVVLHEDEEQLWLDASYCENDPHKKQVIIFDKPYQKSKPEEVKCSLSGAHVKVKVKQGGTRFISR